MIDSGLVYQCFSGDALAVSIDFSTELRPDNHILGSVRSFVLTTYPSPHRALYNRVNGKHDERRCFLGFIKNLTQIHGDA